MFWYVFRGHERIYAKWSNRSSYLHVSCNILNQIFWTTVIVLRQLTIDIRGSAAINIVNKLLLLSTQ